MHTPRLGVVWGSKHGVPPPTRQGHHAVLPTKTSRHSIQFTGSSMIFLRAGSQVSSTRFVNWWVLLVFVVLVTFTLSVVSLSLITWYHLARISPLWSSFSCMTLSHLRTQIRYTDSDRMIWRSCVGPWWVFLCCCCQQFHLCLTGCRVMLPFPRIVPSSSCFSWRWSHWLWCVGNLFGSSLSLACWFAGSVSQC